MYEIDVTKVTDKIEEEGKALIIYAFTSVGGAVLTFFCTLAYLNQNLPLAIVLTTVIVFILLAAILTYSFNWVHEMTLVLAVIMLLLANYLVISGSVEGAGPYFSFLIATLMVLSLGPYLAVVFILLYLGSQTYFLTSDFAFVYPYPPSHVLRIIVGQTALLFMICTSEWVRRHSYYQMQLSSESHFKIAVTDALTGITNLSVLSNTLKNGSRRTPLAL
ncbi:hypothetical protein KJ365_04605 [Glaciecola sp. XM2]|jgi:hypothetical protein|uniref:hypothetical protein n=1 Tax=Glaciecola sp. XM2 TaxID=1914931 RepID=UPI001BDF3A20|nr:hypothetical protein [Glaciecola sp. XM2]MBT1450151.1 hypothetical protein [Glaciecola sp. XM2]